MWAPSVSMGYYLRDDNSTLYTVGGCADSAA